MYTLVQVINYIEITCRYSVAGFKFMNLDKQNLPIVNTMLNTSYRGTYMTVISFHRAFLVGFGREKDFELLDKYLISHHVKQEDEKALQSQ